MLLERELEEMQEAQKTQQKPSSPNKISFSELKIWKECAYKHKLVYIDKLKGFQGNEYTAFGSAIHYVCESLVQDETADGLTIFKNKFIKEIKALPSDLQINKKLILDMKNQGENLIEYIIPALKETFGQYEIVSIEEMLFEEMEFLQDDYNFKGFIDLVIKTPDGKYHVIDWKTCSWGWDMKKKSDPMVVYQLSYYKNFFAKKHNIDPDDIETYFALLKRTAKKNNIEIFKVTNGKKRLANAMDLLIKAVTHINAKNFVKNKLSCNRCEFYKSSHCP